MYKPLLLVLAILLSLPSARAQEICGTEVDAESRKLLDESREAVQAFSARRTTDKSMLTEIPIVTHIFRDGTGSGGLTLQEYYDGIAVLNSIYEQAGIVFTDCTPPIFYNDEELFTFEAQTDVQIVQSTIQLPNVINIYVADVVTSGESRLCGFTYFPGSSNDLIVMADQCFTNGATLSHEMGHYFGLYHTHGKTNCSSITDELVDGSNCEFAGDDVCDTPADPNLRGLDCNQSFVNQFCEYTGTVVDANGQPFAPQATNLMSYAPSFCRQMLTPLQYDRVLFFLENERDYLMCTDFSPPANTFCDSAIVISCNQPLEGDTRLALFVDEGASCGDVNPLTSRGLWYKYTGEGGRVTAGVCTAGYDTQIAVYRGACDDMVCVEDNDDACDLGSQVTFNATEGEEYLIYVTGFDIDAGEFTLDLQCEDESCPAPAGLRAIGRTPNFIEVEWQAEAGTSYNIQYGLFGSSVSSTFMADQSPALLPADACGTYSIKIQAICAGIQSPFSETTNTISVFCNDDYCFSYGNPERTYIERVELSNVTRNSVSDDGYFLYADESAKLNRGADYSLRLVASTNNQIVYWNAWIDLNGDGDFTDAGENVVTNLSQVGLGGITTIINVGPGQYYGITRMRIAVSDQPSQGACGNRGSGEVEDYLVDLSCDIPTFQAECALDQWARTNLATPNTYIFNAPDDAPPTGGSWLVDGMPSTQLSYADTEDDNLTVEFPASATYEICYGTEGADGCIDYCCDTYCINLEQTRTIATALQARDGTGIEVSITDNGAEDITWYRFNEGDVAPISESATYLVPYVQGDCRTEMYYATFRSADGCWKSTLAGVNSCAPADCADQIEVAIVAGEPVGCSVDSSLVDVSWMVGGQAVMAGEDANFIELAVPAGAVVEVCATFYDPLAEAFASCCVAVESAPNSAKDFGAERYWEVFPNPANSYFQLAGAPAAPAPERVELFDVNGRAVRSWSAVSTSRFLLSDLPGGVYHLRISRGDRVQVTRLVVK